MAAWSTLAYGAYAAGEYSQALLPYNYARDGSRRVVVWCHGASATFAPGPVERLIAAAGFPMIACDLGGPDTWGSDTSLARVTDAWTYAKANYGVKADKMILWGGSMGSLTATLYA